MLDFMQKFPVVQTKPGNIRRHTNYVRVHGPGMKEIHFFLCSDDPQHIGWAVESARAVSKTAGGSKAHVIISLWKPHPLFKDFPIVTIPTENDAPVFTTDGLRPAGMRGLPAVLGEERSSTKADNNN
jgi:hypothetical protein